MLFYCVGGLLWYSLFLRSHYLPRVIPLFGLAAVILALAGTAFQLLGASVPIVVFLPLLPFELLIGGWLLLRGIESDTTASARLGPAAIWGPLRSSHARRSPQPAPGPRLLRRRCSLG